MEPDESEYTRIQDEETMDDNFMESDDELSTQVVEDDEEFWFSFYDIR